MVRQEGAWNDGDGMRVYLSRLTADALLESRLGDAQGMHNSAQQSTQSFILINKILMIE